MVNEEYPCLLIAGEKSGEDHALSFVPSIKERIPSINFFGVGGDSLKKEGMELIYHLNDFSSFGFSEVIFQIPFYLKAYYQIIKEVKKRKCKLAILIDFQTFNLKLATRLKKEGVEVLYYVAPHAWVWKAYRATILEKTVHTLFTLIPFEKKWFENRGVKRVKSVPHPLIKTYKNELNWSSDNRIATRDFARGYNILCLPGSRKFEVRYMLPEYIEVLRLLKLDTQIRTSIVLSPSIPSSFYEQYLDQFDDIYSSDQLASALKQADIALATSGTVTLACALFELPSIVCYKGSFLNEFIYNYFIRYKGYVSLANIVQERKVFPELLQKECIPVKIHNEVKNWINNPNEYYNIRNLLSNTKNLLSGELNDVAAYMSEVIKTVYGKN